MLIEDESITNIQVSDNAAISYLKGLDISSANIRGLEPYYAGTGIDITNGELSIPETADVAMKAITYESLPIVNQSASLTIDWAVNSKQSIEILSDVDISFYDNINVDNENLIAHLTLFLEYGGSYTVEFSDSNIKWPGGLVPELDGDDGNIYIIIFYYRDGYFYGNVNSRMDFSELDDDGDGYYDTIEVGAGSSETDEAEIPVIYLTNTVDTQTSLDSGFDAVSVSDDSTEVVSVESSLVLWLDASNIDFGEIRGFQMGMKLVLGMI